MEVTSDEIATLLHLRSIMGRGPCAMVGCEGCACEMQMASDEITRRLKELGVSAEEWVLDAPHPVARCRHVQEQREKAASPDARFTPVDEGKA